MDPRKLPRGRFGRLGRVAWVGARLGASKVFDRSEQTAAAVTDMLGTLRGLASKIGQMASYVDGVIPETQDTPWQKALAALRAAAPASPPDEVRAVLESDLGAPLESLFESFDRVPFASASIGQVHRARLADGRLVAVKVQHPGIAKALESDLSNAGLLETVITPMVGRHLHAREVLAEARARFREELDYTLEAERLRIFARIHAGEPSIVIPAVIDDRSAKRVLTAELVEGLDFDAACAADPRARALWAATLWRFVFRGILVGGIFNADPHPGNYLFQPDGRVAFLDFGCVQLLSKAHQRLAVLVHVDASERDDAAFRRHAIPYLRAHPGQHEALAVAFMRSCFEPLFASPFRMTREYVAGLVRELGDSANAARKLPMDEVPALPEGILFMNRLQFGFYSVLARLDVAVDYAAVEQGFLEEAKAATRSEDSGAVDSSAFPCSTG